MRLRKQNVFSLLIVVAMTFFSACTSDVSGELQVKIVQPTMGEHCRYTVSPATLTTLDSLRQMRGKVGQIVTSSNAIGNDLDILAHAKGLYPVDTEFIRSKGVYFPVDAASLFAATTYYAMETGYKLFSRLDTTKDVASFVSNFSDTRMILWANIATKVGDETHDNAAYVPVSVNEGSILNFFLALPTNEVKDIPLGLNLGIMIHEYTHMIFHHLFWEPGKDKSTSESTLNTVAALDEGMADYFGFLATQDPGFFLCSFPEENRDMRVPKSFTAQIKSAVESGTAPHDGGAVWASIQYEIGKTIGFEENGKALYALMPKLLTCGESASSVTLNFGNIAKCHLDVLSQHGRNSTAARAVYQKYMGVYGAL